MVIFRRGGVLFFYLSSPGGSNDKESVCNAGDLGLTLSQEKSMEKRITTIPIFLPGEFHEQSSLAAYSPWGSKSQT